jgi:hypothetical protein
LISNPQWSHLTVRRNCCCCAVTRFGARCCCCRAGGTVVPRPLTGSNGAVASAIGLDTSSLVSYRLVDMLPIFFTTPTFTAFYDRPVILSAVIIAAA